MAGLRNARRRASGKHTCPRAGEYCDLSRSTFFHFIIPSEKFSKDITGINFMPVMLLCVSFFRSKNKKGRCRERERKRWRDDEMRRHVRLQTSNKKAKVSGGDRKGN